MAESQLANAPLGHEVAYPNAYDPALLFPIAREVNRADLPDHPEWHGADIWNAYEISWLNPKGKPVVALARFVVPCDTPNLIESKSFKLYLNSFNEVRFDSLESVRTLMAADLGRTAGGAIDVRITPVRQAQIECGSLPGVNIDDLDIEVQRYLPDAALLRTTASAHEVSETLTSDLLKSNCPVTGQPDWGSILVQYTGPEIDRGSLLQYVISLRQHNEFHEHCVEQMFSDIWQRCRPSSLLVYARYTRRGGLDINPWRSTGHVNIDDIRTVRQ